MIESRLCQTLRSQLGSAGEALLSQSSQWTPYLMLLPVWT